MVFIGATLTMAAVPGVANVIRWHWDSRRVHRRNRPEPEEGRVVPARQDRQRPAPLPFFSVFLVLFARMYMAMLGQGLRLLPSLSLAVPHGIMQRLVLQPIEFAVLPAAVRPIRLRRAPSALLSTFLAVFVRAYMAILGQALRIASSTPLPVLYGVWQRLVLPVVALPDIVHAQANAPLVRQQANDSPFFATSSPTSTSAEETRVLRRLLKFMKKLQDVLRSGRGAMSTKNKARAVFALVAKNKATLRTCRVPFAKTNVLLAPVADVASLLRPRTGTVMMTEAREAYLMEIIFGRADVLENAIAQALWIGTWPTVPTDVGAIAKPSLSKGNKTSTMEASPSNSAVNCGHRRRASAVINPRWSHLRGSGAVVT